MCPQDGVDNMAAHVCPGAARRRRVGAALPRWGFSFSLSAFLFARRHLASDKVTPQPDSCVHLSAPRLLSQRPRGRPEFTDRWPNGVRGRQGRRRPRAAAKCYFRYLLIQKSLSVKSLNSNKRDLKITAAVIDRVAKPFFFHSDCLSG